MGSKQRAENRRADWNHHNHVMYSGNIDALRAPHITGTTASNGEPRRTTHRPASPTPRILHICFIFIYLFFSFSFVFSGSQPIAWNVFLLLLFFFLWFMLVVLPFHGCCYRVACARLARFSHTHTEPCAPSSTIPTNGGHTSTKWK